MLWLMKLKKTKMVVGWFEEELWVVRGSCGTVLVRREFGLLTNHNRLDCEGMCGSLYWIDYEVLECDICEPLSLWCPQIALCAQGWVFQRRISCFEMIVAISISAWWPILIKWKRFWEWTRLNGGIPKELKKCELYIGWFYCLKRKVIVVIADTL